MKVPTTLEDYTRASRPQKPAVEPVVDMNDFYDDFDPDEDSEQDESTGDSFYSK